MSYESYKLIHYLGLMFLFVGLGIMIAVFSAKPAQTGKIRGLGFASHGVGLLFLLVSGFGMLGGGTGMPGWVIGKSIIWLAMGGAVALIKRKSEWAPMLLVGLVGLGGLAAALALNKPL